MSGRRDPFDHGNGHRTEPVLGNLDHLDAPAPPPRDDLPPLSADPAWRGRGEPPRDSRPPRRRPGGGWGWPVLALLVVALGFTLWINQGWLRGQLPHTELNGVLARADAALAQGHLDGNDGTSARELYEAARALEPDNDRALAGLHNVGEAEIARADTALLGGHLQQAGQSLDVAHELLGGGPDVDRLTQAIAHAQSSQVSNQDLVDQAQQAYASGKLVGPDGAGALYQRLLSADPGNAIALHGLNQVGDALAAQIHKAVDANDAAAATNGIDQLAALLPGYGELPALRAAQAQLRQQHDAMLAQDLQQGENALRAGNVTGPGDDTALAHFKAALALDPQNANAQAGLGQVAESLIVRANAAIDSGDMPGAATLLDQAAALAPRSADLAAARARLQAPPTAMTAATAASSVGSAGQVAPALTPQQQTQIAALVRRAGAAAERGDIMMPPGNCAYDLYRSALGIDGNNADALKGLQQLPGVVVAQFNRDMADGNLGQAGDRLADLAQLSPGDAGQDELRQRLSGAWLDQGQQSLNQGDRVGAAEALEQARRLTPMQPRVEQFAEQLAAH